MTIVVVLLLVAGAVAGVLAARYGTGTRGILAAGVPAVFIMAAALVALAVPPAHGAALGAVRVAAVIAAMAGGSSLVTATFAVAHAASTANPAPFGAEDSAAEKSSVENSGDTAAASPQPAPLRGGLAIGILERAAIAICILANFAAGLAVIVAVKGLARYPELRNPHAAEQFIIGTFVSVLWACSCAGIAVAAAS